APTNAPVSVTDTLPDGLTATAISGTGWDCILAALTCTRSDVLAPAGDYPLVTVTVNVAADAPAGVTNTANVSGGGQLNTANHTSSDLTAVGHGDLAVAMNHIGSFTQGDTGRIYSVIVHNHSSEFGSPSVGMVTVTAVLHPALAPMAMSGSGWSCNVGTLTC